MTTILVTTAQLAPDGMEMLTQTGANVIALSQNTPPDELHAAIVREQPEGIISRTLRLDRRMLEAATRLRVISKYGVGYDNIDVAVATERGVPVLIARGGNSQSVAELAMGLTLAVARSVPNLNSEMKGGQWRRMFDQGIELHGGAFGIVGFGSIGRRVAPIAQGFGMNIHVYDPLIGPDAVPAPYVRHDNLHALLRAIDVLSLHCPMTPQTRGMIGAAELALMKRGAILINAARGGIVDEAALLAALQEGRLAGAGLDTFAVEPLIADSPFKGLDNVVLTPHAGGSTGAAARRVSMIVAQNLLDGLEGRPLNEENLVNPEVLARARESARA